MFSRTSSLAAAAYTLFIAASAAPDAFPFTNEPAHQLVNRADVIITTGAGSDVQPRLEIGNLATRDDEWALYIKTMANWQQAGSDDTSGYYGVASIHGVPLEDWNGAEQCSSCSGAAGYGTHDMVIFPTWHRLYLSHFEQEFLAAALEVAQSYPASSRDRMLAAQKTLRLPYWDWAAVAEKNSSTLPEIISSAEITINGPDGPETLNNPLYNFEFTEAETKANYYAVFTGWLSTYRYPISDSPNTTSQDAECVSAFGGMQESLQDQVYGMLTACSDFLSFSDDEAPPNSQCANSLETIHNTVHTLAGGAGGSGVSGGHMTYLPLSSYDPVFWLHHANVDRLFALWQTINADSWMPTYPAPHDTWVIPAGAELNGDYPLEPFNKDASSYWTSNEIRDWTVLGYTYPEYVTSPGQKSDIVSYVNALYGSQATLEAGDISAQVPSTQLSTSGSSQSSPSVRGSNITAHAHLPGLSNISAPIYAPSYSSSTPSSSSSSTHSSASNGISSLINTITGSVGSVVDSWIDAATGSAYEYSCNIQTPRYSLNGSYYVYVFNGQPAAGSCSAWMSDSNLIGAMGIFSAPNGHVGHDLLVTGQVPLTRHLRNQVTIGTLLGMDENTILPYLTKNLQWAICKNGEEIDVTTVEGFSASVYSNQVSVPSQANELPSYTKYTPQIQVTKGKTGGASKPIFSTGNDTSPIAPSYGSGSSSSASQSASAPAYGSSSKEASPTAPAYGSTSVEAGPNGTAASSHSSASNAPSASPYETATASATPSVYESPAVVSPAAETCAVVTTTVKHIETIYVTASATAPAYNAPQESSPVQAQSSAPAYSAPQESSPVGTQPSAPAYNAPSSSVVTVVPVPSSPVENSPVVSVSYQTFSGIH